MGGMKRWQFWLGVLISIVLLYLALRGLGLQDLGSAMQQANYWWLIPGVAVYFVGVWVRAWRWHYLLRPIKAIPTRTMFPIVAIGYMGNNIYPARAGEVLRAVVLEAPRRRADFGLAGDDHRRACLRRRGDAGLCLLQPARAGQTDLQLRFHRQYPHPGADRQRGVHRRAGGFLAGSHVPGADREDRELPGRPAWFQSATGRKSWTCRAASWAGWSRCARRARRLMVFLTSVVIWLLETGKYWFVMHAFPFQVSFFALMLMNGIVNLATTIPSAPGYVGTFDAPGIAVLQAYGVNQAVATAYTLVLHVALWFPITVLAAYYFLREGLTWSESLNLKAEFEQEKQT